MVLKNECRHQKTVYHIIAIQTVLMAYFFYSDDITVFIDCYCQITAETMDVKGMQIENKLVFRSTYITIFFFTDFRL